MFRVTFEACDTAGTMSANPSLCIKYTPHLKLYRIPHTESFAGEEQRGFTSGCHKTLGPEWFQGPANCTSACAAQPQGLAVLAFPKLVHTYSLRIIEVNALNAWAA